MKPNYFFHRFKVKYKTSKETPEISILGVFFCLFRPILKINLVV